MSGNPASHGDSELRDAAREIVDNWTLDDPNPLEHTRLLDQLSQFEVSTVEGTVPLAGEGLRFMQIAIETNASGDHVLEAIELMLEARELTPLLDLLGGAPDAPDTVSLARRHLGSPEILRRVLLEEPIDAVGSQRLLDETGPDAAAGLVDALAISESQGTRRLILERLAAMGGQIAPLLAERLPRVPWYVQRNILALLARLKTLPAGFEARGYAEHPEVTVRFQALSVMVRQPKEREEAIHLSLADADPRVREARPRCRGRRPPKAGRDAAHGAHQQPCAPGGPAPQGDPAAGAGADTRHARLAVRQGAHQAHAVSRTTAHGEVARDARGTRGTRAEVAQLPAGRVRR